MMTTKNKDLFNANMIGVPHETYIALAKQYGYEPEGDWNTNISFKNGNVYIWKSGTFWVKADRVVREGQVGTWFVNHKHITNLIDAMEGKE